MVESVLVISFVGSLETKILRIQFELALKLGYIECYHVVRCIVAWVVAKRNRMGNLVRNMVRHMGLSAFEYLSHWFAAGMDKKNNSLVYNFG